MTRPIHLLILLAFAGCRGLAGYDPADDAGLSGSPDQTTDRLPTVAESGMHDVRGDTGPCAEIVLSRPVGGGDHTLVSVPRAGYYEIWARELGESCGDQTAEGGYLTVENACNPLGFPKEATGGPLVVPDLDNGEPPCLEGFVERLDSDGNKTACCTPRDLVFFGTFWFDADADSDTSANTLMLHHMCKMKPLPDWLQARPCNRTQSIHLRLDGNVNAVLACMTPGALPCANAAP